MWIKNNGKVVAITALLFTVFFILALLNIFIGSVNIPFHKFLKLFSDSVDKTTYNILFKIRIPRMLACIFLGGALSVSGFLLQTFFNNPIAGPFVLGISSGAKMMVSMLFVVSAFLNLQISSMTMVLVAFVGSLIVIFFILLISTKIRSSSFLIVAGIMFGYLCSAVTDLIITFADDAGIAKLHSWTKGSFSGIKWTDVKIFAVLIAVCVIVTFLYSKKISAFQLGEVYAKNLGVNIKKFQLVIIFLSSFLAATVTAFAGPISFVGIAVPHMIRFLFKTAKPVIIIPNLFLGGAAFCLFCDLIARTMFSPTEILLSSVTSVFGAPIVIAVMIRKKKAAV